MHRVELKDMAEPPCLFLGCWFLMHRVELKGTYFAWKCDKIDLVPNAPCGVERFVCYQMKHEV